MTEKKCVGFMGGHGTLRTDEFYTKTALTAKLLAEAGYFVVSGGGPGIMEATNLGAYFAKKSKKKLFSIETLAGEILGEADGEVANVRLSDPIGYREDIAIKV